MHHRLECPRCGDHHAVSADLGVAWDDIHCETCGEFLETRQALSERVAPSLLIESCLRARQMGIAA
ncbi:hypothetical protein [Salinicola avicenniae]|uniref:hypothetical protein n=1 Tax=Salinicola avicenniae TaxID=2916836 RepID=UPI002073C4D7|nr:MULTISPECIES: hypothetical protein [unclassified Salinicola]